MDLENLILILVRLIPKGLVVYLGVKGTFGFYVLPNKRCNNNKAKSVGQFSPISRSSWHGGTGIQNFQVLHKTKNKFDTLILLGKISYYII